MSKVVFNARKIEAKMRIAAGKSLDLVAIAFQKKIRQRLNRGGTGVHHSGQSYPSSAPGEPPTVQSGNLQNSWIASSRKKVFSRRKTSVLIDQGTSYGHAAKYAFFLEYGTRHMAARPFVLPTVRGMRRVAPVIFQKKYKKLVQQLDARGPYG
tara:strand:+ start:117 stop:575 length:459 start_codon:yes stop_codon:yes gene_type:complete